jgi:chloride channel 3/4/5
MVDWLHEVVKASARSKHISSLEGIRGNFIRFWDQIQGWITVALIGFFTAVVAYLVDVAQASVFDWKLGIPHQSTFLIQAIAREVGGSHNHLVVEMKSPP